MKHLPLINWCVLGIYALILAGLLIFSKPSGPESGMAKGYTTLLLAGVGILALVNLLPFQFVRIFIFVLCVGPAVMALVMTVVSPIISRKSTNDYESDRKARATGSYYFADAPRRQLAAAIAAQDLEQCKTLLARPISTLNQCGKENWTILDFAAIQFRNNRSPVRLQILDLLLDKGALIDNRDPAHSPTHVQILDGDIAMLEWFLKNGADANAVEAETRTPVLYKAITGDNSDTTKADKVRLLLEHGANPNTPLPHYDERVIPTSMLLSAADSDLWEICNHLLDHGADPFYQTESGWNIFKAVEYQAQQFQSWGETPPDHFTLLLKRLDTKKGSN